MAQDRGEACSRLRGEKEMVKLESSQSVKVSGRAVFVGCCVSFNMKLVGSWGETFDCRHIKTKEEHDQESKMVK